MRDEDPEGSRPPISGIVVGGSAGAVETLKRLTSALVGPLSVPLLVVVHFPETAPSLLPGILHRASGSLPSTSSRPPSYGPAASTWRRRDSTCAFETGMPC